MLTDEMESKGPVTFIVGMCGQRKDNKIENIASAYSVAVTQLKDKK
jgi:predicted ATPase